ncbi:MAG: hypothetical protein JWN86_2254 [Planctomycetota bacterium]|nr:hypothetical protein [Planctomycetota bacterium]
MRRQGRIWLGAGTVMCAMMAGGWLLAQDPDTTTTVRGGAREGIPVPAQSGGVRDSQIAIAHGLAMAIEGSTLRGIAMQSGGSGSWGTGGGAGAGGAGGTGRATGAVGTGNSDLGGAGTTGATGVGSTGGRGGGSPGSAGSVGAGAGGSSLGGTTGSAVLDREGPGATAAAARAAAGASQGAGTAGGGQMQTMAWRSAQDLNRYAQRSFDASDRLLRHAAVERGDTDRFYLTANRYASTVRTLSMGGGDFRGGGATGGSAAGGATGSGTGTSAGSGTGTSTGSGTGTSARSGNGTTTGAAGSTAAGAGGSTIRSDPALRIGLDSGQDTRAGLGSVVNDAGSGATGGAGIRSGMAGSGGGGDLASIALINHGVKEALDAMEIRQMVRMMGSPDGPAALALLAHAREMEIESRQAIDQVVSRGAVGGAGGAAGAGGAGSAIGGPAVSSPTVTTVTDTRGQGTSIEPRTGGAVVSRTSGDRVTDDSRTTVVNVTGAAQAGDRTATGLASQPASVALLAQQARDVLDAIQEIGGDHAGGNQGSRRESTSRDGGRDR